MRAKRSVDITEAVKGYYEEWIEYYRQVSWQKAGLIPRNKWKDISPPEMPQILVTIERVDRYGLPNPGTWMDQPQYWLEDIEAARLGRDKGKGLISQREDTSVSEIQEKIRKAFDNAPTGQPLARP